MTGIAQALGQFGFGYTSDRECSLDPLIFASTLVLAVAVFLFWYIAKSLPLLVIFALMASSAAHGSLCGRKWARLYMEGRLQPLWYLLVFSALVQEWKCGSWPDKCKVDCYVG
jgi:hypothetical protein